MSVGNAGLRLGGIESAFYSNLILLGINVDAIEKKYGCRISPTMFHGPNSKGMEIVLYFLLTKAVPSSKDVCVFVLFNIQLM